MKARNTSGSFARYADSAITFRGNQSAISISTVTGLHRNGSPVAYDVPNHSTLPSRSRSSAPSSGAPYDETKNASAIAVVSSSDHSRRSVASPPAGNIRSIHSTNGRHIGQLSEVSGGYSCEPKSIAPSTTARVVAGSVRVNDWSASSIKVPILIARSSNGSGTIKASLTTVPRLWSTYTRTESACPDGSVTP